MFCGECGTENPETNSFCKNCGKPLRKKETAAGPVQQPVTAPPPVPGVHRATSPLSPMVEPPKRSWLGIISLVPAILAWIVYPVLLGIAAVVIGITAIILARKQGMKFPVSAVIAIIIGMLAIILNIFWLDIFPPPQVLPPIQ